MNEFAKLFTDIDGEQILVTLDSNDEGNPAVTFTFDPCVEGLGLSCISMTGKDSEEGWQQIEKAFISVTEEKARSVILQSKQDIKDSFGDSEDG